MAATASTEQIDAGSAAARSTLLEQVKTTQATGRLVIDLLQIISTVKMAAKISPYKTVID